MNKSKFLKKSLAMLLALMLVVAMIPLSASAAGEAPAVAKVWIDGKEATLSGTTYSAEIVEPGRTEPVEVEVQLENDNGTFNVAYYDILDQVNNATKSGNLYTFDIAAGETSTEFYTTTTDGAKSEPYTVTFTTVDASDDAGVLSVSLPGMYDWYADDITDFVIVPHYGWDFGQDVSVELSNENAKLVGNNVVDGKVNVTAYDQEVAFSVEAESGKLENYTVKLIKPVPFSSFAIEDERHESQISRVTEEPKFQVQPNGDPQVEVYLPYNYEGPKFTPVFETNYDITVWADDVEIVSGETYSWEDLGVTQEADKDVTLPLVIEYSDHKKENWTLNFDGITADVEANIDGLTVQNYVAEIEGTTITLTIPASIRTTKELVLDMSKGTDVKEVVSREHTIAWTDGPNKSWQWKNTDLTKDEYTLRVTAAAAEFDAEGVKAVKDYTLIVENAVEESPKLNSMKLKNEETGEEIVGTINKDSVVFEGIPYRINQGLYSLQEEGWQLFWSATSGTTITSDGEPIALSGSVVKTTWDYLPEPNYNNRYLNARTEGANKITVANTTSSQEYAVVFTSAKASQDSTLTELDLAENGIRDIEDVSDLNTTALKIDNETDKITANIYFNEFEKYVLGTDESGNSNDNLYRGGTLVGELPYESEIYFVYGNQVADLNVLNEETKTVVATDVLPTAKNNGTSGSQGIDYAIAHQAWEKAQYCTGKTPLKLIVVSEAGAEGIKNGDAYTKAQKLVKDGLATEYELTLTQMKPRDDVDLTKVSIYDAYSGDRVYAEIKGDESNFDLPYYFIDGNRKDHNQLYFDYEPQRGGVTVTTGWGNAANEKATLNPLAFNEDGEVVASEATAVTYPLSGNSNGDLQVVADNGSTKVWIQKIYVDPENPNSKTQEFTVNVTIVEPEEDAELNSVTIAGSTATPNSKNEVTVNVPKATEVTSLTVDFNISKNAYVVMGGPENIEADGKFQIEADDTFNFLAPRKFTVVSEDGNSKETYTITVVPSETFVDVDPDDWFYDEVMTAADKGWVAGEGNGVFNPNGTLKRGDFALMIARILGYDEASYSKTAFPDVASDKYYSAAVAFCKENNIIDGDDKGNFNGEDAITREQMAKILCQALQLKVTIPEKTYDDDAKIAGWAKDYVYACQEAGVMEGDNGSFRPKDNATRAEAATVLVRAFA